MGTTTKTFNLSEARTAQKKHCAEKGLPHFAPSSGICYSCRKNIYEEIKHPDTGHGEYTTGISVEEASSHVTGCPHCHYSYCD